MNYWTDGSNKGDELYSYGCVVVSDNDEVVHEACNAYDDEKYKKYRNVAGETYGVLYAILHALTNKYTNIKVYHDYIGLQKWADGEWNAGNILSQWYVQVVKEARQTINIEFVKVKAHTGVEHNERADDLAKQAIKEWLDVKGDSNKES